MSLMELWSSSFWPSALMLMGTLSTASSLRVAVTRISSRAAPGWLGEESSADCAGGGTNNADISTIGQISMHVNSSNLFIIPSGVDNYNVLFFALV